MIGGENRNHLINIIPWIKCCNTVNPANNRHIRISRNNGTQNCVYMMTSYFQINILHNLINIALFSGKILHSQSFHSLLLLMDSASTSTFINDILKRTLSWIAKQYLLSIPWFFQVFRLLIIQKSILQTNNTANLWFIRILFFSNFPS